jgi:hypothetical protein
LSSRLPPQPPLDPPSCPLPTGLCAAMGPLDPMKPNPPAAPADPVLLFITVAWLAAEALAALCCSPLSPWCSPSLGGGPAQAPVLARAPAPSSASSAASCGSAGVVTDGRAAVRLGK